NYYDQMTQAIAERYEVDLETPWEDLPEDVQDCFLYGTNGDRLYISYRNRFGRRRSYTTTFEGIVPNLERRYRETDSDYSREKIEEYMSVRPCPECDGARLRPESLAVRVGGQGIHEVTRMSAHRAIEWFEHLELTETERQIARLVLREIDERLRELGNTVIVVEHDEGTMRAADHIVDLGPGAGEHGGRVVAEGTPDDVMRVPDSLTGEFLAGERQIEVPARRRRPAGHIEIEGAAQHNLQRIDVKVPLGVFCCVTGVSGSGKSTLVNDVLHKAVANRLHRAKQRPGAHRRITGGEQLDKITSADQSPIGRAPRSNPATYLGLFDQIAHL